MTGEWPACLAWICADLRVGSLGSYVIEEKLNVSRFSEPIDSIRTLFFPQFFAGGFLGAMEKSRSESDLAIL